LSERLLLAHEVKDENPDAAYGLCMEELQDNPDQWAAWAMAGSIACKASRLPIALACFERVTTIAPQRADAWNNLGTAWHELKIPAKARECFRRALSITEHPLYLTNIGATYSEEGNHIEALKWIRKAERMDPALQAIPAAAAFAELATGDWANGWKHWDQLLGVSKHRKKLGFGGFDWDGKRTGRLIVYGEQGLGDEIMFASCIADCRPLVDSLVIECDPRLEGLYRRSFPWAEVYGTRRGEREWDITCDAQVACGSLPGLFRPTPESCPRTPYLTADPERRVMWRALFDSWGKPVIGIAWSGGRWSSQSRKRAIGLEAFRPLIESQPDAVYVSLQYQDDADDIAESGLPVRSFQATKANDYDEVAALVAELDDIVGIHTTAHHLRGAMGRPSRVLVPYAPLWSYASGDRMPWYAAQVYHRQRKDERWIDCIKRLM
jgi:tetratricopeptide (TPR) repeat protein